ncbi:conserved exported hypothetical protein [Candidatus Terasakiella magnetica]|uniref:Solute-binding protein family 3/N-terminal domain-containing protein n=1 Tax=Candidatus Terasakiella magnetica TaxID=1867952 RepID=A0A1C3RKF6_9PROT|nr:conserved exported hypothetical protein [Candidatus Terasakiella magnetica]
MKILLFILCMLLGNLNASAQTVFTSRMGESLNDRRQDYVHELMKLALDETVETHGSYLLKRTETPANMKRSIQDLRIGKYENYFVRQSVSKENLEEFVPVPFPVDLGIVGYRLAFTSREGELKLKSVNAQDDLTPLRMVQGIGWLDTDILRHYGFNVETSNSYESMFKIVAKGRADVYWRGANEVLQEWKDRQHIKGLVLDKNIILYYPLPRFYLTSKGNEKAAERLYEGLIKAFNTGKVLKLWKKYYGPSLAFTKLETRKNIRISNPFLKGIDRSYEQYIYNPFKRLLEE